jgi:hypothetical protein
MRIGKRFLTNCELSGVRYIFKSTDEECHEVLAKYSRLMDTAWNLIAGYVKTILIAARRFANRSPT